MKEIRLMTNFECQSNLRIGVVARPLFNTQNAPLIQLLKVLSRISDNITVITGESNVPPSEIYPNIKISELQFAPKTSSYNKAYFFIRTDLEITIKILQLSHNVDVWFFFTGGDTVCPMIPARLLKKKIVTILAASARENVRTQPNRFFFKVVDILFFLGAKFSDYIVLYSDNLIKTWDLEKYSGKIFIAHEHHLDFQLFRPVISITERSEIIGYVGRLSKEKGICCLIVSAPLVIRVHPAIIFSIIGNGPLMEDIKSFIEQKCLVNHFQVIGWVSHDDLPLYFNRMKLLILPSYTEVLPNVVLEAMACGTIVLVSPVGALPWLIKDDENGFIMENNSPECIARNIGRVLKHPTLNLVMEKARESVLNEYSIENAVFQYRRITNTLIEDFAKAHK